MISNSLGERRTTSIVTILVSFAGHGVLYEAELALVGSWECEK